MQVSRHTACRKLEPATCLALRRLHTRSSQPWRHAATFVRAELHSSGSWPTKCLGRSNRHLAAIFRRLLALRGLGLSAEAEVTNHLLLGRLQRHGLLGWLLRPRALDMSSHRCQSRFASLPPNDKIAARGIRSLPVHLRHWTHTTPPSRFAFANFPCIFPWSEGKSRRRRFRP